MSSITEELANGLVVKLGCDMDLAMMASHVVLMTKLYKCTVESASVSNSGALGRFSSHFSEELADIASYFCGEKGGVSEEDFMEAVQEVKRALEASFENFKATGTADISFGFAQ